MRDKELRLALVCYGGISLAVYMHGITREIWHLARASRAFLDGDEPDGVERVYHDILAAIAEVSEVRLRVLPDIIAGASAGGINGIFLARAIATGQSLDPLTELWLAEADVDRLTDPAARAGSRFAKFWATPLGWALTGRKDAAVEEVDPVTREEVADKLGRFVRGRWFEPPFSGPGFSRLLLRAFDAMASGPTGVRLLPPEQPLDLFVTVTDFHGHSEALRIHSPGEIAETEHRLTLAFRDAAEPLAGTPELVFAARATASFPGAFPPFTAAELDAVFAEEDRHWPKRDAFLADALPAPDTVLIDGSVLANAPFGPAIAALADRPSRREVDRRFVYIDPKPGYKSVSLGGGAEAVPGFFKTLLGALSDIPRSQPIRDNIEALSARSQRTRTAREVIEALRPALEAQVDRAFARTRGLDRPNAERLALWRHRAMSIALAEAGPGGDAYLHLRLAAFLACQPQATRPRHRAAARALGIAAYLERYDLAHRRRLLRALSRRLVRMAEDDAALAPVRDVAYRLYAQATGTRSGEDAIAALDAQVDADLADALAPLDRPARRRALFAWLGLPFADVATYALLDGGGVDEFDAIKIDRIAPDDAQSLRQGDARATLKGIRFNSFGAFFSRAYRENDYLWGCLHAAERLIEILLSSAPPQAVFPRRRVLRWKRQAFEAILDREAARLTAIAPLIDRLRADTAAMTRQAPRDPLI